MEREIKNREEGLERFFSQANRINDDEIKSHLASLGLVLMCGYVERCVEAIITERLILQTQPRVIQFIKTHFKKGTNYNCETIHDLLGRFDESWKEGFRLKIKANQNWSVSLKSVYTLRNSIAHGGTSNTSLEQVKTYYEDCKNVIASLIWATSK